MKAVLFGSSNDNLSVSGTRYHAWVAPFVTNWANTENARTIPISEEITITKFKVWLDTAPGSAGTGSKYTFNIRDDGATVAGVDILETATDSEWTGSVTIADNSLVCLQYVPLNSPNESVMAWWTIEYTTAGQSFLMMGTNVSAASASATNYANIIMQNSYSASDGEYDILVPANGTLTALRVATPGGSPGAGKSYAVTVNRNNGTDDMTATISDTNVAAEASGSVAWSPGDSLGIKITPSGTPTARRIAWCLSVTPENNGEVFCGFGSLAGLSADNLTRYEQIYAAGNNAWNTTESTRYCKPPDVSYKNLYAELSADPAGTATRTITFMDNTSATALTVTISAGATTGNDTTHTVNFSAEGNVSTIRSTAANTPVNAYLKLGYVMVVDQGSVVKDLIGGFIPFNR